MKLLLSPEQMKISDACAAAAPGMSSRILMERAACAALSVLRSRFAPKQVMIFCGSGNNGGDGYALARFLQEQNLPATVFAVTPSAEMTPECQTQAHLFAQAGGTVLTAPEPFAPTGDPATVYVDAILGIGLNRPLTPDSPVAEAVRLLTQAYHAGHPVLALDIPTGLSAATGRPLGLAAPATVTVTFGQYKTGLFLTRDPAAELGETVLCDIDIPPAPSVIHNRFAMELSDLASACPRPAYSHKGTFGTLLCIVGSEGMSGAATLCAKAAYRTGAGIVRVLTPESNRQILQITVPEAITHTYRSEDDLPTALSAAWETATAVVIGCGLSQSPLALTLLEQALLCSQRHPLPLVLDADALNLLSAAPHLWPLVPESAVLTPHLGEMSRLCHTPVPTLAADLVQSAVSFSRQKKVICLLKDAITVAADPQENAYVALRGNAGMATGGSGDVLAGITGGLLAQTRQASARLAAVAASLHAQAGNAVLRTRPMRSLMASDIIEHIWELT